MISFFRFDTNEEKHALLDRARNVALTAILRYEIAWDKIQFIQLSDTITYKLEATPQESYLLRIHSDRCSRDEIASELAFLQMLHYSKELMVPTGVASKVGSSIKQRPIRLLLKLPGWREMLIHMV
ncbi:aminoglycoside phosphotransferase [Paenibacillus alvei TS-15]|uniref:Aminoglycoside phosphotransferase n=1 Tax=Paenibacillus alvei TS-15 TaxID=1117108 RepID=S9SHF6_PAEAL|nr:aminoglycoside phosphotransferase [Paenibacillus alvei]EPY05267.1 aminoglycoside phosphotransferase [Paenibacillus alvei TS-15]